MTFNVGVVGSGWVAQARHIPAWKKAGAQAIYVLTNDLNTNIKTDPNVTHVYHELTPFISLEMDYISICTPPSHHKKNTIDSLQNGAHILLEKPISMNSSEAKEILKEQISSKTQVHIGVSHNLLFSNSVEKALNTLNKPDTGNIIHVSAFQASSFNRRLPVWYESLKGGLFWDESPHILYIIEKIIENPAITRSYINHSKSNTPNSVSIELQGTKSNASAFMLFGSSINEWHVTIYTENKTIDIDLFRDICIVLPSDKSHTGIDVLKTSTSAVYQHLNGFVKSGIKHATNNLYYGHDKLIQNYVSKGKPPITLEKGLSIINLMETIIES